jgi:uroporphyrinogen-III synthase
MANPAPRILITRSPSQASGLAQQLADLGLHPIAIPAIDIVAPASFAALDAAITNLPTFHWLIFTSANAVEAFTTRRTALLATGFNPSINPTATAGAPAPQATPSLLGTGFSPSVNPTGNAGALAPEGMPSTPYSLLPPPCLIASIGPATARALEAHGLIVNLLPPQAIAESLTESLVPHALQPDNTPTRFLLVRAEVARDHLPETLRSAGAQVTIAPAYRTIIPETSIAAIRDLFTNPANYPDAITFTSSSTATNLLALVEASNLTLPPEILRISIGPITSQTLRDLNLPPHAESPHPTLPALAATVFQALNASRLWKTLSSPPEAPKAPNPL